MNYLVFHPSIDLHKTDNEQTIKMNEIFKKKYEIKSLEWFVHNLFNKRVKVIYLNWFENTISKNNNILIQLLNYTIKRLILRFCKKKKIKIIYAIHNKVPHGVSAASKMYKYLIRPFIRYALDIADIIVIHSKYTDQYIKDEYNVKLSKKIIYIPIGKDTKYVSNYDAGIRKKSGIDESVLLFGYIGRLTRYKQIENAIIAFQKANIEAKMFIIGNADPVYQEELNRLIISNKIMIEYRYIDDFEMNAAIREIDVMILPYDYSCLNSGPMLQAFLNGTNVLGTAIGTSYDFPQNLLYTYNYSSNEDHIQRLVEGICHVKEDFDSGALKQKNIELQKYIFHNNNWEKIEEIVNTII